MCIAIPLRVLSRDGSRLTCERADGVSEADMAMCPDEVGPGDWVLVFRGSVLRRISAEEASRVTSALTCLDAVMSGERTDIDAAFADIIARSGQLPEHLRPRPADPNLRSDD